ncbi:TIGR01777 family oxidoreductase [Curtobacterium sp. MCBD17_003]|uniref:TIGR01777 family oxidoreductase n=1 Tax=Curtobacterium sp. MCBD17_003 TaxID=2175667 RepID=UPI000DA9BF17|nr:TIGR01777 family oxidoreductase [Curtobacterium sp. MCBD17_003]WIE55485.1 TIGR01777 family oxidoreductase [Curtobacterium sp. MCBD17_003]
MADAPLSVLVAGASGFIGTPLVAALRAAGHHVTTLVRREPTSPYEFRWQPGVADLDPAVVDGADVVVNLAGASIARLPWTAARRRAVRSSRLDATRTLVTAMQRAATPPNAFLSGSASGYYGDRPADRLIESADPGAGFLAEVCTAWEAAASEAPSTTRTVLLRTGLVLGPDGGALAPVLPLTRLGLGSRLGTGGQYWPWISLEDEVAAIVHLCSSEVAGPVNLAGPTPALADHVLRRVAQDLHRPYALTVPETVLRLALRDAADELLLASQLLVPAVLQADGYTFRHETVEQAVDALLG